jgi:polyhydroxybutyrate depolymerase
VISRKVLFVLVASVVVLSVGIVVIQLWPKGPLSKESFQFDGLTRTYFIHVPPSYDGSTPVPLVIVLHGYTGTAEGTAAMTAFTPKSDREGFIVVYPEGLNQRWNVGFGGLKFDTDDVGFINELINRLEQKYEINLSRIYVTGFSNGAMMSYLLGAELSDKIAAIAPVAGSIGSVTNNVLEQIPEPSYPVSAIVFHGTADTSVPYGGDGFLSVAESIAFWVRNDECSLNPQNETSSNGQVIKSVYAGGAKGTEVVLYTLIDVSHVWPISPTYYIMATDIIWGFFESHPKQ